MLLFGIYMLVQVLANAILVATCRPMVPILVGRGGVAAVSFGLSFLAFLQYGGQMFMPLFGSAIDNFGYAAATWMVAFPVAALGFVAAFFIRTKQS
jgi:hypothetical protein